MVGLVEIENDGFGTDSAVGKLVAALNSATAPGKYAVVDGSAADMGTDVISCKLIYQPLLIEPRGEVVTLTSSVDAEFNSDKYVEAANWT